MQPHNLHMSPGSSEGRRRPPRLGAVSLLVTDLGVGSTWGSPSGVQLAVVSKGASVGAEHCSAAHARGPAGESTSGCARQRSGTSAPSSGPRSSCAAALKGAQNTGHCALLHGAHASRKWEGKRAGKASAHACPLEAPYTGAHPQVAPLDAPSPSRPPASAARDAGTCRHPGVPPRGRLSRRVSERRRPCACDR